MSTIKTEDILIFIQWVYSMQSFEKLSKNENLRNLPEKELMKAIEKEIDNFKYSDLLNKVTSKNYESFNVNEIEDFFVDVYIVYDKIKRTEGEIQKKLNEGKFLNIFPNKLIDAAKKELTKFIILFENCVKTYDFETPNMRGIQKNLLNDLMNELIKEEKYEECAVISNKINHF